MQILFDICMKDANYWVALTALQDFNVARKILLKLGKMIFYKRQHALRYFLTVRMSIYGCLLAAWVDELGLYC
jgi:hypothetical protein